MKKLLFLPLFLLLLTGCHQKHNTKYYIENPNALKTVLSGCEAMGSLAADNKECINAYDSYREMVAMSDLLVSNPEEYGKEIINYQIQIAKTNDKTEKAQLEKKVDLMLTMIGKSEGL